MLRKSYDGSILESKVFTERSNRHNFLTVKQVQFYSHTQCNPH